ncbi:RNA polymerase sigma factor [Leptospira stimsonii]|uniref:Sigma-70 family RNA polymerase sigma factor n=1 Tax=Leptospira stimsonii TaxID=2202203 RepID=A0ABY2MXX7_9LEPT|nr:sigma-70 family RNA polymerase sigma factor [Leptospira stimsonii]TGK19082.1 sigma-70 family RNA polymerase sigma factor [Leptospira stimsonii]TGM11064.1 sigma-70 family RNA polymerase sigma factor [Leptospira stimsonii]
MTDADLNSPGNKTQEAIRLIYGISKKDPRALEKFYDLFGNLIYSIIYKILMQKEESEEILQEVFTILWNKAEQFNSERSSPLTWVSTIARNAAISKVRSKDFKNRIRTSEYQEAQSPSASVQDIAFQEVFDSSLRIRIQEGIAKLSPEIAILLREAYWSGLSQSELAEKFQLPLGTVKSRIRTGLTQLRDELKGWNL